MSHSPLSVCRSAYLFRGRADIKDGRECLLFARACPSSDSAVHKDHAGVIQQLVCKSREQMYPIDVVHFAHGAHAPRLR
jgi:hypothetical protein